MSCHANELKTRAREEAARAKESRERMDRLVVEQRLEEEEEATNHTAQKERERNQDAARKTGGCGRHKSKSQRKHNKRRLASERRVKEEENVEAVRTK